MISPQNDIHPVECPDLKPGDALDDGARAWLKRRIQSLRSRAASTGPFRAAGIHRTIARMKGQLREGVWRPHAVDADETRRVD